MLLKKKELDSECHEEITKSLLNNVSVLSKHIYQISFIVAGKRVSKHFESRTSLNVIESDSEIQSNSDAYK